MMSRAQELQELNTLVRHVPRIVVSSFMHKPAQTNGPGVASFTAVLAMFDISGFSTLGSNLSDTAKDQIKHLSLTSMKIDEFEVVEEEDTVTPLDSALSKLGDYDDGPSNIDAGDKSSQWEPSTVSSSSLKRISSTANSNSTVAQTIAVDSLTTTLNKSLQPIIDVILRHSGDIIKFAGDTMIVLWETEISLRTKSPPGLLAYRAGRCAVEALRVLRTSTAGIPGSRLGMRIGIGTSEVTAHHVGGVLDRWEFYVSGDANRQMNLALQNAPKGQVALSLETYGALTFSMATKDLPSVYMKAKEVDDGVHIINKLSHSLLAQGERFALKPSLALVPLLRGYVPGTIVSCMQRGLALTSCAREVTAIFIKLPGIVEMTDSFQQAEEIHRVLRIIQSSAYTFQGTLKQLMIDGEGAVATVIMGLPPFYHESNAVHGVRFAYSLISQGIQASVGVTTGTAFCGPVGSKARAEYAVVGASIDLSECLMSAAKPGEIFCDARTYEETKDAINFTVAHQISVKTRIDPVMIYCVMGDKGISKTAHSNARSSPPYDSEHILSLVPVYGDAAVAHGDNWSNSSAKRKSAHRVLIVTGERGTGKTMLLQHLRSKHSRCFMDCGDSVDLAIRLHGWVGIVRDMISQNVYPAQFNRAKTVQSISKANKEAFTEILNAQQTILRSRSFSHGMNMDSKSAPATKIIEDTSLSEPSLANRESIPLLEFLVIKGYTSNAMLPILNDLLPHDQLFKSDSSSNFHRSEERAKALEEIIVSMLTVLSRHRRLLLLFDNAHFMDEASWRLLQHVLEELPNLGALLTIRSKRRVECPAMLEQFGCMGFTNRAELTKFTYAITSLFIGKEYRISIMDSHVLDFVYGRTDGNPAEIIKLVDFMIEEKFISVHPKRGTVKILSELEDLDTGVPQHTRAHVMSCVDNLESLAQIAIKVISVNPDPVEEKLLVSILRIFLNSQQDGSSNDMADIRLKPGYDASFLGQLRSGLAACLRDEVLSFDDLEKRYIFRSEEMRLVVYDTMIPSQRQLIHMLYSRWFTELSDSCANSSSLCDEPLKVDDNGSMVTTAKAHQNLARIAYHLLGAGNVRSSLDAYWKAGEQAIAAKDLYFATECMFSSQKILDEQLAYSKAFSDLDLTVIRCRIEYVRGAIAVEKCSWDEAIAHMTLISTMCKSKEETTGTRRYSSLMLVSSVVNLLKPTSPVLPASPVLPTGGPDAQELTPPPRCTPRIFPMGKPKRQQKKSSRRTNSISFSMTSFVGQSVDPKTLQNLQQISFFRKKSAAMIKIITESKLKREAIIRDIQRMMHQSLQVQQP